MKNRSILISGLGIAGTTLAYWLGLHGFKPTLIERAPRLRTGGYVIDFWGFGYDVAERMEILSDLKREGYDVEELRLVNAEGDRVGGFGIEVFRSLTEGRYVSLLRGDLAAIVYRKIEGRYETIYDDSIAAIEQKTDGVHVTFERMPARRFDLVIGADGQHSVVRRLVFGDHDRFARYLGYMFAAFEIEGYRPREEGIYVSYALPGKQVSRFALRDDRTMFLIVFAADQASSIDPHDAASVKALLHREFDDAGWECPQILTGLEPRKDVYCDRVSQVRMDAWSSGRVALLGDAAFCPSLLAGQGAALAMTAAYVLAGELAAADGEPEQAFGRYEQHLRAFIAEKQKAAVKFAGSFAPRTRFGLSLRNQITKTFGLPLVARLVIGNSLLDRIDVPDYLHP